ncbi:pentatricopeptide repeat-containing protein At2g06000 [Sesamum indicum]|uniref:Pentatricopeptide repeat-containing protein At2g06000 n=1 Tax=Sesamum indicum TaxID=4182 RepID=A0A6I9TVR0_SESIN|nr:pentatricopeptide repeat-containing protein At2g06000 [Sesamum indicum]XP_011087805.1 pentatricopeptide repeat-containing protein At2g06000 [Sesamum indicum]XP_011087806.1 pentatricopeptide repeat-containing protein At2g06000 [Sesamum indicum]XP_011087807.1 pentatricopeptide repeat-containing protein At2g06000 [Sesamum indicum]XP_011087808.1 pentatricopeptide repeat-containing protein At2g06000 [Sesamum indicum]XP_011087809.1 pentatricopeptide repeat-containing protein At2g06000 [Sesamum in
MRMQFWAQRVSISKVFSTALLHGHARIESSHSSPASIVWFIKVVCTLCVHHSHSLNFFDTDYFRESLNPFVAFGVVYHINNRLNNPDLAFSFFRYSRLSFNLLHLESTFNLLLRSLCRMGLHDSAKLVFEYMKADGFWPNSAVLDLVVSSFGNAGKFRVAEEILIAQAEICNEKGETVSSFVYNKFLCILINRNRVDEAVLFFRGHILRLGSFCPDTQSFNIVIKGLCRVGKVDTAFEFLDVMRSFSCHPDLVTYNTLINGFCRVGHMDRAEELLREVKPQSGFSPDVVTYTSVISGYCRSGKMEEAAALFDEMINYGTRPNLFTFNVIIDGFGKKGKVASALKMYERMVNCGFHPDVVTFTSLIDCYCRRGELEQGMKLWDEMNERKVSPNAFTFSILITSLCKENRLNEARDLLRQLNWREDIVPPPFIYNPVIDGFCKAGNIDEANAIVKEMEMKGCVHDKMTFTILILGHCMKGRMFEAIGMYNKMLSIGCAPDNITISSLISCLRKAGMAREANEIQEKASNVVHLGSLSSERTGPIRTNMDITVAV